MPKIFVHFYKFWRKKTVSI